MGLNVIYGADDFGQWCYKEWGQDIDYFVDRRAKEIGTLYGKKVITLEELKNTAMGGHVDIIMAVGQKNKKTKDSILQDIEKSGVDATVTDYYSKEEIKKREGDYTDITTTYHGKEIHLIAHSYNCGEEWMYRTERALEISLAQEYINSTEGAIIEIGAVTPYYFHNDKIKEIVDPADKHPSVTKHCSIFDLDFSDINQVLCISTLEHIGVGDYGFKEDRTAVEGMEMILKNCCSYLITVPFHQNPLLDQWLYKNMEKYKGTIMYRERYNCWKEITETEEIKGMTNGPFGANAIAVFEKIL